MKIKIAVVDDNQIFLDEFIERLNAYDWKDNAKSIDAYLDGDILLHDISCGAKWDIIFMDVKLHENEEESKTIWGTDIGKIIKQLLDLKVLIIYMSSYKYFEKLSTAQPFYFLNKPIDDREFCKALRLAIKQLHYNYDEFCYSFLQNGKYYRVNLSNVAYFESRHRKIIIHMNEGYIWEFYGTLDEVEISVYEIYPFFVRPNKSFLVNLKYAINVNSNDLEIMGVRLVVSKAYKSSMGKKIMSIYDRENE